MNPPNDNTSARQPANGGFSLPIINILLILIIIATIIWGWYVLAGTAILVVLITIGTWIYDKRKPFN